MTQWISSQRVLPAIRAEWSDKIKPNAHAKALRLVEQAAVSMFGETTDAIREAALINRPGARIVPRVNPPRLPKGPAPNLRSSWHWLEGGGVLLSNALNLHIAAF